MDSITLRLQSDTIDQLNDEANARGVSRSEYVRDIIRSRDELQRLRDKHERIQADHEEELDGVRDEYEERINELEREYKNQINELERENERLHRERRQLLEQRDEHTELVEYVEEERSLQQRREDREQRRAQAGVLTRAKWWLAGMPADEADGGDDSNG